MTMMTLNSYICTKRTIVSFASFKVSVPTDSRHKRTLCNSSVSNDIFHKARECSRSLVMGIDQRRASVVVKAEKNAVSVPDESVSLVLLAGGVGKRMGASIPKQYLKLKGKAIATYSFRLFASLPSVGEIVVVCEPEWREVFEEEYSKLSRKVPLKYALPGKERQDSVYNGFQQIDSSAQLVAIHDSARPLIQAGDADACFVDALRVGAAVLGVPVKPTIKEVDEQGLVVKTLKRSVLWEVQTPQVIRPEMLKRGFEFVQQNNLEVTDDVSIVEALGEPVMVTTGSYSNIKVTTPDDMSVAEGFLDELEVAV